MSLWHDYREWVGGFQFKVARPDRVQSVLEGRGFGLDRSLLVGWKLGCNVFVSLRVH